MKLSVLGSSSKGNCYVFTSDSGERLVLECGIKFDKVKRLIKFKTSSIVGCLISHRHGDHAKFVNEYLKVGINAYAPDDVFSNIKNLGANKVFCHSLKPLKKYTIGNFKVFTLPVHHDVPCYSYVIEHEEMGKVLFVTDTFMLDYKIKGLTFMMLEANYSDEIINKNKEDGKMMSFLSDRIVGSHMELKTTEGIVKANDTSNVKGILLIHLSETNSNAKEFKERIEGVSGIPTFIAKENIEIDL